MEGMAAKQLDFVLNFKVLELVDTMDKFLASISELHFSFIHFNIHAISDHCIISKFQPMLET